MKTDKEILFLGLKALGRYHEDGLSGQFEALDELITLLQEKSEAVANLLRVEEALKNKDERIQPGDPEWPVHMTHCYGLDYDSFYSGDQPTVRHSCKYGQDDVCPAAIHEDPMSVYINSQY